VRGVQLLPAVGLRQSQDCSAACPILLPTPGGFGDIYSVQLSVTPTDERTCVTDTCSISAEDPFPLCFSRTTSNNKILPTAGLCSRAPPLLLQGLSLCLPPTARLHGSVPAFRLVLALALTPGRCLLQETGMPCFSPTSRCRPLTPSRGLHYLHPLNASPPLLFQVFAPKNFLG